MAITIDIKGLDQIKDLAAVLPKDLQRAHGVAARSAAAAGYNVGAQSLADATETEPGKWKRYQRVFTSVDAGINESRAWMGLNDYPERNEQGDIEYIPFPEGFDPSPEVGEVMAGAYLRVLDSRVQKIIEGK